MGEGTGRRLDGVVLKKTRKPRRSGRRTEVSSKKAPSAISSQQLPVLQQGISVIHAKTGGYKSEKKRKNPNDVRMNLNSHLQHPKPVKESITLDQDPAPTRRLLSPGDIKQTRRGASDGIYGPLGYREEQSPRKSPVKARSNTLR